jgi:hypothetical protein
VYTSLDFIEGEIEVLTTVTNHPHSLAGISLLGNAKTAPTKLTFGHMHTHNIHPCPLKGTKVKYQGRVLSRQFISQAS